MSPKYFLDRNLGGKIILGLLRDDGWNVRSMNEVYGRKPGERIADVQWITEMASAGYSLITSDSAIARVRIESRAIYESGAIVFMLPTARLRAVDSAARLIKHRSRMDAHSLAQGPLAYAVYDQGLNSVPIAFP